MVNTFLFLPTALSTPSLSHRRTFFVAVKNNYLWMFLWLCITHDIAVFYSFLFFSPPGADQEHRPKRWRSAWSGDGTRSYAGQTGFSRWLKSKPFLFWKSIQLQPEQWKGSCCSHSEYQFMAAFLCLNIVSSLTVFHWCWNARKFVTTQTTQVISGRVFSFNCWQ